MRNLPVSISSSHYSRCASYIQYLIFWLLFKFNSCVFFVHVCTSICLCIIFILTGDEVHDVVLRAVFFLQFLQFPEFSLQPLHVHSTPVLHMLHPERVQIQEGDACQLPVKSTCNRVKTVRTVGKTNFSSMLLSNSCDSDHRYKIFPAG